MATVDTVGTTTTTNHDLRVVRLRHWGRIPAIGVLIAAALGLAVSVARNPNINWSVVGENLTSETILHGVEVTLMLTVASMAVGIILGIAAAMMKISDNPILDGLASLYIWVFRGTPVLVQLIFWFNLGLLFPRLGLDLPFLSLSVDTNTVITGFTAALLGLGLNEGAYMAEIVRAGLLSVDSGQTEAAIAVGLTRWQALRGIVLPQSIRVIIPPTGNEVITMLKQTSLVSVISGSDLLTSAQTIYSRNFNVIELLLVVSIWYLTFTSILSYGQWLLERRLLRGTGGTTTRPRMLSILLWRKR